MGGGDEVVMGRVKGDGGSGGDEVVMVKVESAGCGGSKVVMGCERDDGCEVKVMWLW